MPSSYSPRLRLEEQFTGEHVNTWGLSLNTVIDRLDYCIAGYAAVALTGDYSLTASTVADDEARSAFLKFTGGAGPFTVTIPGVSKGYRIWNATTGPVTITTGSGTTVVVDTTDILDVFCDGTNVKTLGYGGVSLKSYISNVIVGGGAVVPSVVGNSGKFLTNNGAITSWAFPNTTDLQDLAAYTAARTAQAVAFAVAL